MSKLVQIQYDTNCYDIWFSNMSKFVQIQYDTNCYDSYDSQTCWDLFLDTWWNPRIKWQNTLKFEQMAQRMFGNKVIPWIASSKSSDQKILDHIS
jgi:hypothetical protein